MITLSPKEVIEILGGWLKTDPNVIDRKSRFMIDAMEFFRRAGPLIEAGDLSDIDMLAKVLAYDAVFEQHKLAFAREISSPLSEVVRRAEIGNLHTPRAQKIALAIAFEDVKRAWFGLSPHPERSSAHEQDAQVALGHDRAIKRVVKG